MPILILAYPFIEIFLIHKLAVMFSFLDVLFFMLISAVLGVVLMMVFGKSALSSIQLSLSKNEVPSKKVLHRGLMFLGAFLIFLPGVLTDIFGVLLILPGFRHLVIFFLRHVFAKGLARGSFRFIYVNSQNQYKQNDEENFINARVVESSSKKIE